MGSDRQRLPRDSAALPEVRDLSDFCVHWPDLRQVLEAGDLGSDGPTDEQVEVIRWLVLLADRVCLPGRL